MGWINYTDRSEDQITTTILEDRFPTLVPEITDHTIGNILIKMLRIWAAILSRLGYYVDNQARESHLIHARLYKSVAAIAASRDYRIKSRVASSVDLTFTLSATHGADILIPSGTQCDTDNNVKFYTVADLTIPAGSLTGKVAATQAEPQVELPIGTTTGIANQSVELSDNTIADGTILIRVNGILYTSQETLAYSTSTDLHTVHTVTGNRLISINFGDGVRGNLPVAALPITAQYSITNGSGGNVASNTIINHNITGLPGGLTMSVTNLIGASGGADIESIESIKDHVPKIVWTRLRAVTPEDHTYLAELVSGVVTAGQVYKCMKTVELYIVPEGGGIASSLLLSNVVNYFADKKMGNVEVVAYSAGEVIFKFELDLVVKEGYSRVNTSNSVSTNLVSHMSYIKQDLGGRVNLSDIYRIIDETDGVDYANIVKMTPTPYARPLSTTTNILKWVPEVQDGSTVNTVWRIVITGSNIFQLFKNNSFVSNYNGETLIELDELNFTVDKREGYTGSGLGYSTGDQWGFYTYPYLADVNLEEPSIAVSQSTDITINATGGL